MRNSILTITTTALLICCSATIRIQAQFSKKSPSETPAEPGLPSTLTELNAWYVEPPEGQNAATYYLRGFEALQISDADRNSNDLPIIGKAPLPVLGEPIPTKLVVAMQSFAQRNKAPWPLLEQGAKFPAARYPLDLTQGHNTLLPHLTKSRQTVNFARVEMLHMAAKHQSTVSTKMSLATLAVVQSLRDEPIVISQVARSTCLSLWNEALERTLNEVVLLQTQLGQLSDAVAKAESREAAGMSYTRALVGQRVSTLSFFNQPSEQMAAQLIAITSGKPVEPNDATPSLENPEFKNLTQNLKSQRAFAEETFNRALQLRKQPFPDRLNVDAYVKSRMDEAKTNDFGLVLLLTPSLGGIAKKEAAGLAELRLAQTALALEQFRATNGGNYPTALAGLAPKFLKDVPADPFDGQPLRYRKTASGYQLYSIGADLKDDNGKRESGNQGDLVFEVVKAPKAVSPPNARVPGTATAAPDKP